MKGSQRQNPWCLRQDWFYPSAVQTSGSFSPALNLTHGERWVPREISAGAGMRITQHLCCDFCARAAVGREELPLVVADHWKKNQRSSRSWNPSATPFFAPSLAQTQLHAASFGDTLGGQGMAYKQSQQFCAPSNSCTKPRLLWPYLTWGTDLPYSSGLWGIDSRVWAAELGKEQWEWFMEPFCAQSDLGIFYLVSCTLETLFFPLFNFYE